MARSDFGDVRLQNTFSPCMPPGGALEEAVDVMREITGSEDVNIWGSCSGGITVSAFLAHLAARGERKVHSATVAVCVLDMAVARGTTAGIFVTPDTIAAAKTASQLNGVLSSLMVLLHRSRKILSVPV